MDMYPQYKSPLGYTNGDNKIDAYGVDHSGFSTRDELEYQFARQNKENQLIQNYNNQGITKNYPQYGTNFWGSSPDNNYGFGSSNIHNNIENMNNNQFENTVNTFGQNQTEQTDLVKQFRNYFGNAMGKYGIDKMVKSLHNLGYDAGERVPDYINDISKNPNEYDNLSSVGKAQAEANRLTQVSISDVNKHRYVSCVGSFDGPFAAAATGLAGIYKEGKDLYRKWNNPRYGTNKKIFEDSIKDMKNNFIGIGNGLSYSDINQCSHILPQKARKRLY